MNIYFISIKRASRNTAGVKAPSDISTICRKLGYTEFSMPQFPREKNKIYQKMWLLLTGASNWNKLKKAIEPGSVVIYQHPMYGNRLSEKMIPSIQKKKNARFIVLIHDLESLRGGIEGVIKKSARTSNIADNALLKKFDAVICHNECMRQYLIGRGFDAKKLVNLGIFDYLTDVERLQPKKGKTPSIAIAGNLAIGKSAYIYNLFANGNNQGLSANLYGINYQEDKASENMIYHGSFKPEELPKELQGDFGLVWDGNSAETCAGNTGQYLRYNNPHKTSLYLASGMPVIVWSQAANADFVLKNGVGITVDNLFELEKRIKEVSDEEYERLVSNVKKVSLKLRTGQYTINAIEDALKRCGQ